MGLDQYAFRIKKGIIKSPTPNPAKINDADIEEISYWRKHPNLEGWMSQLYYDRRGEGRFNCKFIHLTVADLLELKECILFKELPATTGSFFGTDADEYYEESDLAFIDKALDHIKNGYDILYYSWW